MIEKLLLDTEDQYLLANDMLTCVDDTFYVCFPNGPSKSLKRFLKEPGPYEIVIQLNPPYDFRKDQLLVTRRALQNLLKKRKDTKKYKGVSKRKNGYIARLELNGRLYTYRCNTDEEAAFAYNLMTQIAFPEQSRLYTNPVDMEKESIQNLRTKFFTNQKLVRNLQSAGELALRIPVMSTNHLGIDHNGQSKSKYRVRVSTYTPELKKIMVGRFETLEEAISARNEFVLSIYPNLTNSFTLLAEKLIQEREAAEMEKAV